MSIKGFFAYNWWKLIFFMFSILILEKSEKYYFMALYTRDKKKNLKKSLKVKLNFRLERWKKRFNYLCYFKSINKKKVKEIKKNLTTSSQIIPRTNSLTAYNEQLVSHLIYSNCLLLFHLIGLNNFVLHPSCIVRKHLEDLLIWHQNISCELNLIALLALSLLVCLLNLNRLLTLPL